MGRLHLKRTRTGGEQRGITVRTASPDKAAASSFEQVRTRTGRKRAQLPKLRAHAP